MQSQPRNVQRVIHPQSVSDGAGVKLKRSIASGALDYLDPFLLFDHFGSDHPDDYMAGFPMHPHRGIETVTYMLAGNVDHRDSLGHSGSIGPGDVQWMTAGSGILHEEMPQLRGGELDGFQLWVNLPAKQKMSPPRYQEYTKWEIPEVVRPDGVKIKVIAGSADDTHGPVTEIAANPTYLDVFLPSGVSFTHPVPRGHGAFAYVYQGEGHFGASEKEKGTPISQLALAVLGDGDFLKVTAGKSDLRFLLVSGKPLHEPVARYGPFVMNTEEEIEETLKDLERGTFIKKQKQ
ncbi:MAG: pirin family protein [bacterium]